MPGAWSSTIRVPARGTTRAVFDSLTENTEYEAEVDTVESFDGPGKLTLKFTTPSSTPDAPITSVSFNGAVIQRWNTNTMRSFSFNAPIEYNERPEYVATVGATAPSGTTIAIQPSAKQSTDIRGLSTLRWVIRATRGSQTTDYVFTLQVNNTFKRDFNTLTGQQTPSAIVSDGVASTMFVVGPDAANSRHVLYGYDMVTKERVRALTVPLSNQAFNGIAIRNNLVYIHHSTTGQLLAFNPDTLSARSSSNVTLRRARQDQYIHGLAWTGSNWLSVRQDGAVNRLGRWRANGGQLTQMGQLQVPRGGRTRPVRFTWHDGWLYTVGVTDIDVQLWRYALPNNPNANNRLSANVTRLSAPVGANRNPSGLWTDGTYLWVADATDLRIYTYLLSTGVYVG